MVQNIREELYNMQRKLYKRNKSIIDESIFVKEPDFERYEGRYRRKVSNYKNVTTQDKMINAVMKADIVYVGDYHTCNQSQRSFLRILKEVVKKNKKFVLGFELIHAHNQDILDKFMKGKIEEKPFLRQAGFHQHWIFDLWDNFKPVFDFAKYHRIKTYALDAAKIDASLQDRDEAAGELVVELLENNPGKKIFVLIGDLHLAPQHLPAEVEKAYLKKHGKAAKLPKKVVLYQNSESIYWKLAKKGIEDRTEVVKIDKDSFCRMHTPPMISQQSYINWLEHEEGEIDYADAKHSFMELVNRVSKFLNIRLGHKKDDVEVYTSGDLSFLKKLKRRKSFSKEEYEAVKRQILLSESYYIPKEKIVYLANLSVNHAAEEASHFMKYLCSGPEFPRDLVDAFYANILHETLGFFGSKLINHKRKCLHEAGYKQLLEYFQSIRVPVERHLEYETTYLVTEYLAYEKLNRPLEYEMIFDQSADLFMSITHALGYMLGDKMYYALKKGKIKKPMIKKLFYDAWEEEGKPYETYSMLRKIVKGVRVPQRM